MYVDVDVDVDVDEAASRCREQRGRTEASPGPRWDGFAAARGGGGRSTGREPREVTIAIPSQGGQGMPAKTSGWGLGGGGGISLLHILGEQTTTVNTLNNAEITEPLQRGCAMGKGKSI
jgi:hypothetical protein